MMNGYILLNKQQGISSFKALIHARDSLAKDSGTAFKKIKIGHAGTLDPLAEGLLLCTIGKSTKMLSHLLLSDKKYRATLHLGFESETDDAEGEKTIPEYFTEKIPTQKEIELVIEKYKGDIMQIPPVFSALKVNGKRSCDRIRKKMSKNKNEEISQKKIEKQMQEAMQKKSKKIKIFDIQILDYSYPYVKIEVHCGSGTYIRSLARDIGKDLQQGAYLSFLQRTSIGDFLLKNAVPPIECFEKNIIQFTPHHFNFPSIIIAEKTIERLMKGQKINIRDCDEQEIKTIPNENIEKLLFWNREGELVGMGEKRDDVLIPRKILMELPSNT